MSGDTGRFEPKTAGEMGIRLFDDPPRGFDPVRAADAELAHYGYPHRPDQASQPQAYQRWKSVVSRPTIRIAPLFGPPRPAPGPPGPGIGPPVIGGSGTANPPGSQDISGNWAGRIAVLGPTQTQYPIQTIYGTWTVPRILQPPDGGQYACASWIGLDGQADPGETAQLIQAGTTVANVPDWPPKSAWFEWLPANPAPPIANFEFEAGDVIQCTIDVTGRDDEYFIDEVAVTLYNLTTGKSVAVPQSRPATWPETFPGWPYTVPAPGYTANWILELPGGAPALAQFGSVYYDGCWASTGAPDGGLDAGQGDLLSMVGSTGTLIAQAVPLNPALTDLAFRID